MLRINELKLPLHHSDDELRTAIIQKLSITADELLNFSIFKRSYDARKKARILLIYQLDVNLAKDVEARVLQAYTKNNSVRPSPDSSYKFVAQADTSFPNSDQHRPIVIGFGPCGMLSAL